MQAKRRSTDGDRTDVNDKAQGNRKALTKLARLDYEKLGIELILDARDILEKRGVDWRIGWQESMKVEETDPDPGPDKSMYFPSDWIGDYVYLLESRPGVVKIGMSKDPQRRLDSLNQGNPDDLTLRAAIGVSKPTKVESWIHAELEEYHVRGEWFDIGESRVDELVERLQAVSTVADF